MDTELDPNAESQLVYRRQLPGGGYVAIDIQRDHVPRPSSRTRVCVERRSPEKPRDGQTRLVIAETDGDERSAAFADMYRIASDNAAIARALILMGTSEPERAD